MTVISVYICIYIARAWLLFIDIFAIQANILQRTRTGTANKYSICLLELNRVHEPVVYADYVHVAANEIKKLFFVRHIAMTVAFLFNRK